MQDGQEREGESVIDWLDALSDDELQAVADKARRLLEERGKARKAEALRQIQALAKEHGLAVEVKGPKRRRGRPPKDAAAP